MPPFRMRHLFALLFSALLIQSSFAQSRADAPSTQIDQPTLEWMQKILNNWERICRRHLQIPVEPLPWIIFYDETQALHVNPDKKLLPVNQPAGVSLKFAGKSYPLVRVSHQGSLWLPGNAALPINRAHPDETTMLYDEGRKPFFIAPLPTLYHQLADASQAAALDDLFIGLAAHEMTHTRQAVYANRQIENLRKRYKLPESLDDNIIEREFKSNAEYKKLYDEESKEMSRAILAEKLDDCREAARRVLAISRQRKKLFFVGEKAGYSELEDILLSLEGLAMWVQYKTALDRAPKGEDWRTTLITLARRTDAWSQEEGLGLFLLIERLAPDWKAQFLLPDFPSPFAVLERAVGKPVASKKPSARESKY